MYTFCINFSTNMAALSRGCKRAIKLRIICNIEVFVRREIDCIYLFQFQTLTSVLLLRTLVL